MREVSCNNVSLGKTVSCANSTAQALADESTSAYEKEKARLKVDKIIYQKNLSRKMFDDILRTEIETHLRNNPDLMFEKFGYEKKGPGNAYTYPLHFIKK